MRSAARANMRALPGGVSAVAAAPQPKLTADVMLSAAGDRALVRTTDQVVVIGTSTGGTQALEAVLTRLPATCLGIVIVQHMPEKFTAMFAERLNGICQIEVREAANGDRVLPGLALIAPGGQHMMLKRNGAQYVVEVADGPLVNRHKAVGRCAFSLRCEIRRRQRAWHHHDRDGRRRCARAQGNARRRGQDDRSGRGQLCYLRYAQGGHQA